MDSSALSKFITLIGPQYLLYAGVATLLALLIVGVVLSFRRKRAKRAKAAKALERLAAKSKEAGLLGFGDDNESDHSKALTAKPIFDRGHSSHTRIASDRETQLTATSTASTEQYRLFFRTICDALADNDLKTLRKSMTDALYADALVLCQHPDCTPKQFSDVRCSVQSAEGDRVVVAYRAKALNAGYLEQSWHLQKSAVTNSLKLERIV